MPLKFQDKSMTIQKVVKKAEEAGYKLPIPCELDGIKFYHKGDTMLDPKFWQALGKAMGWQIYNTYDSAHKYNEWQEKWHCFLDHLAEGKEINSFFESL